jgi:tetratricopeptide (TPR) repeat protein
MIERLRSRLWSSEWAPRIWGWTTDRSEDQTQGERLFEDDDFAGAELYLAKAILDSERRQQNADRRILLRLELAEAQRKQFHPETGEGNPQKLTEAEQTIRSAIEMANRVGRHALEVQCLDALATIFADQGNLPEAERLVREATLVEAKLKRRDPLMAARRLQRLGIWKYRHGQAKEAADALAESASLYEQALGPDHLETAHRLSELAAAHHALGNHAETQRCLRRVIRVHENQCGLDSAEAASDLQMLTGSLEAAGDIDGAAAQFERVLALKLRIVGADLDAIADMQSALGHRYMSWRRYARARELLMEAVGTFKRTGGSRLALGYETLAQIEEESGHYHDAIREWSRAGKVWESIASGHSTELIRNLERRAYLFEQLRQDKEAAFLRERAAALVQARKWEAVA